MKTSYKIVAICTFAALAISCNKSLDQGVDPIIDKENTEATVNLTPVMNSEPSYSVASSLILAYNSAGSKVFEKTGSSLSKVSANLLIGKSYSFYAVLNASVPEVTSATEDALIKYLDSLEKGAVGFVKEYTIPSHESNVQLLCEAFDRSAKTYVLSHIIENKCAKTGKSEIVVDFSQYGINAPENLSFEEEGIAYIYKTPTTGKFTFNVEKGLVNGLVTGTQKLASGEGYEYKYFTLNIQAVIEMGLYYCPIITNMEFNTKDNPHHYDLLASGSQAYLLPCPLTENYGAVNAVVGFPDNFKFFTYYGGIQDYVVSDVIFEPNTGYFQLADLQDDWKNVLKYQSGAQSTSGSSKFPSIRVEWKNSDYVIEDDINATEKKNTVDNAKLESLQLRHNATGAEFKKGESFIYNQNGKNYRLELTSSLYNDIYNVWPLDEGLDKYYFGKGEE